MSKACKIVTAITLVTVALTVYILASAQLSADIVSIKIENAADRTDTFAPLADAIERGDLADNQFRALKSDEAADYAFVTYTVELSGHCPISAEWAVLSLSPVGGDVAFLPGEEQDVPPFSSRTINATLLTAREDAEAARNLWVEYYVFGRAMSAVVRGQ